MSNLQMPAADAAVVCLRVLGHLLQDEEVTLAQLSYLIENIHNPLAQVCLPPSQRPIAVAAPQLSSLPPSVLNRLSPPSRYAYSSASSPMAATAASEAKARRLSPQPAVCETAPPAQQQQTTSAKKAKTTAKAHKTVYGASKKGVANAKVSSSSTSEAEARVPLTSSQYWDTFANLPALYTVYLALVRQLDTMLQRLNHIVEELHLTTRDTANSGAAYNPSPGTALGEDMVSAVSHSSAATPASALRNPSPSAVAGACSVYREIGAIVCEFFESDQMKHFMAEHMMYAVKYTQRTAPQMLRLSRLWRWCAESSASSRVSVASLAHLSEVDQKTILQNELFVDFLWRSFGPSGIPEDGRVCIPASSGLKRPTTAGGQGQAPSTGTPVGGGGGGARRSYPTPAAPPPAAHLPPTPAMWEGFRTLLVLLATPLNILRRYSHVARCLVESDALLWEDRERLRSRFVNIAAWRISEETNLVMGELSLHDVKGIMALMDIQGASTNSGGGVGLAGGESINNSSASALTSAEISLDYSHRILIHYGRLLKRFGRGRHERLIFLFSDWLCYTEESSNGHLRVRGTIPLSGLHVVKVRDDTSLDTINCFELVLSSPPKRIIFYAPSPEQRDQWVDAIRYTVQRFGERQKNNQVVVSGSARDSKMSATARNGGVLRVMRPTAPMLMSNSRLSRQRRNDAVCQGHGDLQRRIAEMAPQPSRMISEPAGASSPAVASGLECGSLPISVSHSSPLANAPSGDPSHDGSFSPQLSSSTHRQLDYDAPPCSQLASVDCRIRSQDFIASHQQHLADSSSSHIVPPTQTVGAPPGIGGVTGDTNSSLNCIVVPGLEAGNMDRVSSVHTTERSASPHHQGSYQLSSPLISAPVVPPPAGRHSTSSLRSLNIDGMASTNGSGGGSNVSTPLRRTVLGRFEAIKRIGSEKSQQHQQRTNSASLRDSLTSTWERQPQQGSSPFPEKVSHRVGGSTAASPPLSHEVHNNAAMEEEEDEVAQMDLTAKVSESIEDDDQLVSLASLRHAAAAVQSSLSSELLGLEAHQDKEDSTSSSVILHHLINPVDCPTLLNGGMQASNAPPPDTSCAQHSHSVTQGPINGNVDSIIKASPTPAVAREEENGSRDARPAAAAVHKTNRTGSVMSAGVPLEHSVNGSVEEDGSATPTAVVTACRPPRPAHRRPMAPTPSFVKKSRQVVVAHEKGNVPAPFRAFIDSPTDLGTGLAKGMGAEEPLNEAVTPCHVDPVVKGPHDRDSVQP
ncbi:putative PH domain containing protein [Leishmania utingensis]|uniref:PH domain containing protein n=1 Tax=Leishmania utingensis TaxID=653362 RepID=A0AAW3AX32_9TRYP